MITINCFDNITDENINLVEMIVMYVMNDLGLKHNITVNINTLEEMDDSEGLCCSDNEIDICYDEDFKNLVSVIAHELRHVWQKVHNSFSFDSSAYPTYEDLPWEKDAFRYQDVILEIMKSNQRNQ